MIVLWAEGGSKIGSGHLNRSIDIFNQIKGALPVKFFAEDSESIEFYRDRGFEVEVFKSLLRKNFILITDLRFPEQHPNLFLIKNKALKHISINDMGLSQIDSDIVIDGHIKQLYPYKKRDGVEYYTGTKYFILKTKFRHFNKVRKRNRKIAKHIYLSLGGWSKLEDLRLFTELILKEGYSLTISWGFGKTKRERRLFRKNFPSVKIVTKGDFIPRKYYEADIAILAGGISFYEAASTGTPSILFYKDEFQKFTVDSFLESGYGVSGGNLFDFDIEGFIRILNNYKYDFKLRKEHSDTGKYLVDGLGLIRVQRIIEREYKKFFK